MPNPRALLLVSPLLFLLADCSSGGGTDDGGATGGAGGAGGGAVTTFIPNDPLFARQWHLRNTGQSGAGAGPAAVGEDLNVVGAWAHGRGTGVRIAIVDDGMDITHPDLAANVVANESHDYTTGGNEPTPALSPHGTACAGLAAAVGNNNLGVTGVSMASNLVGYNLLQSLTGANEADAMARGIAANHIYSNSWGATDGTGVFAPSAATWRAAVDNGVATGRGGRGAIYTWAAGNGSPVDRSDYDGQSNYHAVFAVGALNDQGRKASYSEPGSNVLISAYGGEQCDSQLTTSTDVQGELGYNDGGVGNGTDIAGEANYTRCFNGTSAATPEVSGVIALMLEANPSLTWRQVRWALASTARRNDPTDPQWGTNGAGRHINEKYGYGVADATAATAAARSFDAGVDLVSPQRTATRMQATAVAIPDGTGSATSTIDLTASGLAGVEFVDVVLTSDHAEFGELTITLTSPSGTVNTLATPHPCAAAGAQVACGAQLANGQRFGIVRLLGERADGTWTLTVADGTAGNAGQVLNWNLNVYGY
jgi:kexin